MKVCSIDWCDRKVIARGWCPMHYQRWKNGVDMDARLGDPAWLFWQKVDKRPGDECWEWTGYVASHGYGKLTRDGVEVYAHRVAYELEVGPIPDGLVIDHLCRNTTCVRPSHLEPVPSGVNVLRGESPSARYARRTHCDQGHPLSGDNAERRPGRRRCKTCRREADRARYAGPEAGDPAVSRTNPIQHIQATAPKMMTSPTSTVATAMSVAPVQTKPIMARAMARTGLMLVSLAGGWVNVNG